MTQPPRSTTARRLTAPSWPISRRADELIASGLLTACPRFSKFVHGSAVLFPDWVTTVSGLTADIPGIPHSVLGPRLLPRRAESDASLSFVLEVQSSEQTRIERSVVGNNRRCPRGLSTAGQSWSRRSVSLLPLSPRRLLPPPVLRAQPAGPRSLSTSARRRQLAAQRRRLQVSPRRPPQRLWARCTLPSWSLPRRLRCQGIRMRTISVRDLGLSATAGPDTPQSLT